MLFLIADENFNNDIFRGLLRIQPDLDIVRVQDVGLFSADDPAVLEWAANEDRILLTHDVVTITKYPYERINMGKYMPASLKLIAESRWEWRLMKFFISLKFANKGNFKGKLSIYHYPNNGNP